MLLSFPLSAMFLAISFFCDSPIVKTILLLLAFVVLMSGSISRHD